MKYLVLVLLLFPSATIAEVYKCKVNGTTAYQQSPCDDGETVKIRSSGNKGATQKPDGAGYDYLNKPEINIKNYCVKLVSSYSLQKHCIKDEKSSRSNVKRLARSTPNDVVNYCYDLVDSWSLRESCIKSEAKAKRSLN